ncbi:unnamed protein product, partial [Heterotrigona itama]
MTVFQSVGRTIFSRRGRWNTLLDETVSRAARGGGDQGGSSSRAVALHEVPMAQGNTYPVVGLASYSSLESRRLPSVAPPTRDTTFNPHTPPMASYYYHCARAACLFHLRPPPPLEDVQPPPRHVEPRRSHSMRPSPF